MPSSRRSAVMVIAASVAGVLLLTNVAASRPSASTIPDRLADSTFWRIVSSFSEPSGTFSSENFVSNETEWQYIIPPSLTRVKPGAYLGVGPEQNFTYIAAFHPKIAFICDIRRQNLIEHLMYKALIEMSRDRAGFLSMLWSRPRPEGLDTASDPATILAAYRAVRPDSAQYRFTLDAMFARLVDQHKFALTSDDSATLRTVYGVFFAAGPDISYSSSSRRPGLLSGPPGALSVNGFSVMGPGMTGTIYFNNGGVSSRYSLITDSLGHLRVLRDSNGVLVPDTTFRPSQSFGVTPPFSFGGYATFGSLMTEDDGDGVNRGWLGSEAAFQWLKDFETRNLVVPVVGDFGGPKALRAIAAYLKQNDTRVSAFYTSNVEQYLFQNRINDEFYGNVAEMPTDSSSMFIRSFPSTFRGAVMPRKPGSRLAQTTSSIDDIIRAFRAGTLTSYTELAQLQDR